MLFFFKLRLEFGNFDIARVLTNNHIQLNDSQRSHEIWAIQQDFLSKQPEDRHNICLSTILQKIVRNSSVIKSLLVLSTLYFTMFYIYTAHQVGS